MKSICLYFQVHEPFKLRHYTVFDINSNHHYFEENREGIQKRAREEYLPANKLLLELIKEHKGRFRIAFSISGVFLEQMSRFAPEVIKSFKELAKTGHVEFLSETYHHSLSYLFSKDEFKRQVNMHRNVIVHIFNMEPKVFRNTELIFNNDLARDIEEMGFTGILAEGTPGATEPHGPNHLFSPKGCRKLALFLRNERLSNDIAVRFSQKDWDQYPLTGKKYASWLVKSKGELINIFMDYDEFTSHRTAFEKVPAAVRTESKQQDIHEFLRSAASDLIKKGCSFITPSDAIIFLKPKSEIDIRNTVSWKGSEKNLSPWVSNELQNNAIKELYAIESQVLATRDMALISDWRRLSSSDYFNYMDTGSMAMSSSQFHPHGSPYDTFIAYMNILNDLILRVNERLPCITAPISDRPSSIFSRTAD